jgi:hypothetical protein
MKLIDRVPDEDDLLAMVADGPLRALAENAEWREKIQAKAQDDPKLAQTLALM